MKASDFKKAWQFVRETYELYFLDYEDYRERKRAFIEKHGAIDPQAKIYAETCYIARMADPLPTVCANLNFKRVQNVNIHNDYTPQAIIRMNNEYFVRRLRETYPFGSNAVNDRMQLENEDK